MNPITLLERHRDNAKAEIDRLDVELEITRERWKKEEQAYSVMVEDRKRCVAEHGAYRRVLLALEKEALRRRPF